MKMVTFWNKYFSYYDAIRFSVMLRELFPEGYEVISFNQESGISYNYDGVEGFTKKPKTNMVLECRKTGKCYHIALTEDSYGSMGTIQYLTLDFTQRITTNVLGVLDIETVRKGIQRYIREGWFENLVVKRNTAVW